MFYVIKVFAFILLFFFNATTAISENSNVFSSADKTITDENILTAVFSNLNGKYMVYQDKSDKLTCSQLDQVEFTETSFPYKPGLYEGILWFDLTFQKTADFDNQRYVIELGENHIDVAECFVETEKGWKLISRTGHSISRNAMTLVSITPVLPLMNYLFKDGAETTHIRIRVSSKSGDPINIKVVSNTKFLKRTTRFLSNFSFSGGVGLCIMIILLLTGILLRDPAYIYLSIAAFFYVLRVFQTKGSGPVMVWNFLVPAIESRNIEYLLDGLEVLFLTITCNYFILKKNNKPFLSRTVGIIFELTIIELILVLTLRSKIYLYIFYLAISILQKILMAVGLCKYAVPQEKENRIIFIPWIFIFSASAILRILLIIRNFTPIAIFDSLNINALITSTFGFITLTIPPLYIIGRRFNTRFQFIQTEYQTLEKKFIENERKKLLVNSVTQKITEYSYAIVNSVSLLSKLNYSATCAEYIELIRRESSKIHDLLHAASIAEGLDHPQETQILLLEFFNSCMTSIKRFSKQKKLTLSLTTAIANDTVIMGDPGLIQLILITFSSSILFISKNETRFSIYFEENDNSFTLIVSNQMHSEPSDNREKIMEKLNNETYIDFILETAKIYNGTLNITKIDNGFRFSLNMIFKKVSDKDVNSVLTTKTIFEPSDITKKLLDKKEENNSKTDKDDSTEIKPETKTMSMGDLTLEQELNKKVKDPFEEINLSKREREITALIIEGKSDKEIGDILNISPQTVATHNKKIFKKAGVHSRVELINKVR